MPYGTDVDPSPFLLEASWEMVAGKSYQIYQQYTTAIKEGYANHPRQDITQHAAAARTCREWLKSLEISPQLRATLVEQIRALEEAFAELIR